MKPALAIPQAQRGKTFAFSANGAAPYQPGATPQESESENQGQIQVYLVQEIPIPGSVRGP